MVTGTDVVGALMGHLQRAFTKHPRTHASVIESLGVLLLEVRELEAAVQSRVEAHIIAEAYDVAASAIRLVLDHELRQTLGREGHA